MINRVVLVGRLTRDPELRYTSQNVAVASFTLAVNRKFANSSGTREADFINCIVWRNQAENISKYLHKGSLIGVEGRLQTGSYEANDGTKRYTTDVICDSVQFLEPKNSERNDYSNQNSGFSQQRNFNQQRQNTDFNQSFQNQRDNYNNNTIDINKDMDVDVDTKINIMDDDLPF